MRAFQDLRDSDRLFKTKVLSAGFATMGRVIDLATSLPENTRTVFVFNLPYAVPVPDGSYQVKVGPRVGTISVKRIQRQPVEGFSATGNLQMRFDKYGKSSFSRVTLTLPWIVDFQERGRSPVLLGNIPPRHKAKETVLLFVNRFIETVRYVNEEYWVEPARYQDLSAYEVFYWDGTNKNPTMFARSLMDTGVGGMSMGGGNPFQMEEGKIEQLKEFLRNETKLDASRIFILNSKDACLQEDFRLAIIEVVTALEIVLYKFIRQQGRKLEITKEEMEHFIKEVGLTGNISVVLKMLTKGHEQIDEVITKTCKGAIKIRNRILHEGLRELSSTDTEQRIVAVEKMVHYLNNLIASMD